MSRAVAQPLPEPGPVTAFVQLLETPAFQVGEFRCPGCPPVTDAESAPFPEIVLPRQGAYVRRDASGSTWLDRTVLGFFEPGRPYVIEHPRPRPDITTVISLVDQRAIAEGLGLALGANETFHRAAVRATPGIHIAHAALMRHLAAGRAGRLAAEESAVELIGQAIALTQQAPELARREGTNGARWRRDIAMAVADYLNLHYRKPVSLEDVAAHAGYSVFHLCRTFQAEMAMPIHRYLLGLRLEAAMCALAETDHPITTLALELGFSSSSHFTTQFTRWAGMPPSEARRRARG